MKGFVENDSTGGYRTVVWPLKDIPVPEVDSGTRVVDLLEMSLDVSTGRHKLNDYLPALVCWVVGGERGMAARRDRQLEELRLMNELQDTLADGYRFTLLMKTNEATGAVYAVMPADRAAP